MDKTIKQVVSNIQCCSCGICAGVCSKSAISLDVKNGILTPKINKEQCVQCGICLEVCPGKSGIDEYVKLDPDKISEYCIGEFDTVEICRITDMQLLSKAASGGVVSSIIYTLLEKKAFFGYTAAFVVKASHFDTKVKTEICFKSKELQGTEKSRYISVSQEDAVRYMLLHRNDKLIITGTSCAVQGILNVINRFGLDRNNYLLIGLFCDKLMSYHVWEYFEQKYKNYGKINELYFKDKGKSGWPGDLKLVTYKESIFLPKKARLQIKDFFCHPRCIYCVDKLNRYADISVGDNYTKENAHPMGSCCVIVRNEIGKKAYDAIKELCITNDTSIEKIINSQEILKKSENLCFAKYRFSGENLMGVKLKLKYSYKRFKIFVGKLFYRKSNFMKLCIVFDEKIKK